MTAFKKYFKYEMRRMLLPLIVITVICTLIAAVPAMLTDFEARTLLSGGTRAPLIWIPQLLLGILCLAVPMLMFSFKMSQKQVDSMYSMPISRTNLYFVKALVGLILVLVPYTVAYWLAFMATALSANSFALVWFLPLFFASIPIAIALFGFVAFVFTRANRKFDGLAWVVCYCGALALVVAWIVFLVARSTPTLSLSDSWLWVILSFIAYVPLILTSNHFQHMIHDAPDMWTLRNGTMMQQYPIWWLSFALWGVIGAAAWFGLLWSAKKQKAENAGRVSDSWFGYRTLIPYSLVFSIAMLVDLRGPLAFIFIVQSVVSGAIAYFIFRRSVHLKTEDLIIGGSAIFLGVVLSLINFATYPIFGTF